MKVRREKSIYHTLNMLSLDVTKKCLVAEGWSPVIATKQVFFFHVILSFIRSCLSVDLELILYYKVVILFIFFGTWNLDFQIQDALERAAFDSNSQVGAIFQVLHTRESPPTYFQTNKFTSSFQGIVDAYG